MSPRSACGGTDTPAIDGLGDWLTNAGRLTGLACGYGVVVLVALMARLPPLERGVGADRLARWHAMGGRYTVSLVVTHALLDHLGIRGDRAHLGHLSQTNTLLMSYPDVLAATLAGLLFVGVGISSARAARRRLRYETWYYLHFYTYLAIALAFSHQFADGAEFIGSTRRPRRLGRPVRGRGRRHHLVPVHHAGPPGVAAPAARAVGTRAEAPGVVSVVITGRHLDELRAEPGQFFRWRFLARGPVVDVLAVLAVGAAAPDLLRITVKALGGHSRALAALRPGTRVLAEGPYGALTAAVRRRRKVLLIAGGVGITPMRALFETTPAARRPDPHLPGQPAPATWCSATSSSSSPGSAARGCGSSPAGAPSLGYGPAERRRRSPRIPGLAQHDVYVCGPPGMTPPSSARCGRPACRRRQHPPRVLRVLIARKAICAVSSWRSSARRRPGHPAVLQDPQHPRHPPPAVRPAAPGTPPARSIGSGPAASKPSHRRRQRHRQRQRQRAAHRHGAARP